MNGFLTFFLIVSTFACNVFCTINPSNLGLEPPPPPANRRPGMEVEFDECFVVPEISCRLLKDEYDHHHICPKKLPTDRPLRPFRDRKFWYIVGKLKDSETPSEDQPQFDYWDIEQTRIKFTYLKDNVVKLALDQTTIEFQVKFQSLQQAQAFYGMVYRDVHMEPSAVVNLGLLHEITTREIREVGKNLHAQEEIINRVAHVGWYMTLKNQQGEPLMIYFRGDAASLIIKPPQLLWRIHTSYYILTFPSNAEAKEFNHDVGNYIDPDDPPQVDADVKARFDRNQIKMQ